MQLYYACSWGVGTLLNPWSSWAPALAFSHPGTATASVSRGFALDASSGAAADIKALTKVW